MRQAFDAASANDKETFARLVAPGATSTILSRHSQPLEPADLQIRPPCHLSGFRSVSEGKVVIEGICENRSKAKGRANVVTWPVELEVYLRGGRIIEVNRLVFPM